jgi:hypothetical protein
LRPVIIYGANDNVYSGRPAFSIPINLQGPTMLYVDIPTLPEFKALATVRGDACVSIYLPTTPLPQAQRSAARN